MSRDVITLSRDVITLSRDNADWSRDVTEWSRDGVVSGGAMRRTSFGLFVARGRDLALIAELSSFGTASSALESIV